MRRALRLVAINFAVLASLVVLLAVLVPMAVRLFDLFGFDPAEADAALPNYQGQAWAATHFREIRTLETEYRSFVGWRRKQFAGETIVIEGPFNERRTPLPATASGPTVFFFGGSTMWGTGSRDQDTIPALYAAATGRIARNFGESGYTAHQNLEMLLWLLQKGERPDVVVFYDGVNDVAHKCVAGRSDFTHMQEEKMRFRLAYQVGTPGYYLVPLLEWLGGTSAGGGGSDCADDPAKAKAVAEALIRDWETARLVAESEGIRFVGVLQPVVYYSDTRTDQLKVKPERDADRRRQYEAVYPLLRQALAERGFTDFTAVLDRDEYLYIDFCHLSPNGNALVAEAFAELIE